MKIAMSYPLSEIEGLSEADAARLKYVGIRTAAALLEAARTPRGRRELAARTGIAEKQFLDWANAANFLRIKGVGRAKTELLRAAGVTTVRELAFRNPQKLAEALDAANKERQLVSRKFTPAGVQAMIEQAKHLPTTINY